MTPISNRRRKELASLARRKGRVQLEQLVLEGTRSVQAAADAGVPLLDIVLSSERIDLVSWAESLGCPVSIATPREMAMVADVRTSQGVAAAVSCPPLERLTDCRRVLALDGVQDPGNVGTLIRSAAWFGIDGVLAGPGTADFFSPKTVRATMGAVWDVRLDQTDDLAAALIALARPVWMADLTGQPSDEWTPTDPSVLVLGSEAHGPSEAVSEMVTGRVCIPARGPVRGTESLNVASAGAILLARWSTGS